MSDLRRFSFDSIPVTPWRNGGGVTREIVCWPPDQTEFDWRASMATVATDGPFSIFHGIDRSLSLLSGAGFKLLFADGTVVGLAEPGEPFCFAGEQNITATLLDGVSTDFNIMTRRGKCSSRVTPHDADFRWEHNGPGLFYALSGSWNVNDSLTLEPSSGVVWTNGASSPVGAHVRLIDGNGLLLAVAIDLHTTTPEGE